MLNTLLNIVTMLPDVFICSAFFLWCHFLDSYSLSLISGHLGHMYIFFFPPILRCCAKAVCWLRSLLHWCGPGWKRDGEKRIVESGGRMMWDPGLGAPWGSHYRIRPRSPLQSLSAASSWEPHAQIIIVIIRQVRGNLGTRHVPQNKVTTHTRAGMLARGLVYLT